MFFVSPAKAIAAAAVLTALTACAQRQAPYHFRAPVVSGVDAPDIDRTDRVVRSSAIERRAVTDTRTERPVEAPAPRRAPPLRTERPRAGDSLAGSLRALVGARDHKSSHVEFARRALHAIGAALPPGFSRAKTGAASVRYARGVGAFTRTGLPLLGDIVVFDKVTGSSPASLFGVVVSRRGDGTIEFVYLARGVVRRGWVNPRSPQQKRNGEGRIMNTFVRHSNGRDPRGTRYLAGDLYSGFIRLDQLR